MSPRKYMPGETPNSSAPPMTKRQRKKKKLERDYPSYNRLPSPNPLTYSPTLTDAGAALRRLGLTEKDVADAPNLKPLVREAIGSVDEAIELLRTDDSPDSRKFIRKWDSMSETDQKHARLEHVVIAAGLTTRRFIEILAGADFDFTSTATRIFVSRSRLKVMKSTVSKATDGDPIYDKEGKLLGYSGGDVRAMEVFHKITGDLPMPKPSNFILNKQINIDQRVESTEPKTPLQAMDAFLLEIDDVRKPKQLSRGAAPVIPVEMPDSVPEIEYLDVTNLGEGA